MKIHCVKLYFEHCMHIAHKLIGMSKFETLKSFKEMYVPVGINIGIPE